MLYQTKIFFWYFLKIIQQSNNIYNKYNECVEFGWTITVFFKVNKRIVLECFRLGLV